MMTHIFERGAGTDVPCHKVPHIAVLCGKTNRDKLHKRNYSLNFVIQSA